MLLGNFNPYTEKLEIPKSYQVFSNFKKRVLNPLIKNLKKKEIITFEYELIKTGKKVISLNFNFKKWGRGKFEKGLFLNKKENLLPNRWSYGFNGMESLRKKSSLPFNGEIYSGASKTLSHRGVPGDSPTQGSPRAQIKFRAPTRGGGKKPLLSKRPSSKKTAGRPALYKTKKAPLPKPGAARSRHQPRAFARQRLPGGDRSRSSSFPRPGEHFLPGGGGNYPTRGGAR